MMAKAQEAAHEGDGVFHHAPGDGGKGNGAHDGGDGDGAGFGAEEDADGAADDGGVDHDHRYL